MLTMKEITERLNDKNNTVLADVARVTGKSERHLQTIKKVGSCNSKTHELLSNYFENKERNNERNENQ